MATLKIFASKDWKKLENDINDFMKKFKVDACPIQAVPEQEDPGFVSTTFYAFAWYKPRVVNTINGMRKLQKTE
jgi:hypothetical protein